MRPGAGPAASDLSAISLGDARPGDASNNAFTDTSQTETSAGSGPAPQARPCVHLALQWAFANSTHPAPMPAVPPDGLTGSPPRCGWRGLPSLLLWEQKLWAAPPTPASHTRSPMVFSHLCPGPQYLPQTEQPRRVSPHLSLTRHPAPQEQLVKRRSGEASPLLQPSMASISLRAKVRNDLRSPDLASHDLSGCARPPRGLPMCCSLCPECFSLRELPPRPPQVW